jgi:glutathione S-transferase
MSLVLYELLGKDDLRFSPFAWRVRLALAHKGLAPDQIVPCRFTEKDKFAFSGQDKVPVLVDGPATVADSWKIACYLEDQYPNRPSLFGGHVARGLAKTLNYYCDGQLHPVMARIILGDVFDSIDPIDRDYFRKTREARFGMTIEAMHDERERHVPAWTNVLLPVRLTVRDQPFLSGEAPAYPDYTSCSGPSYGRAARAPFRSWQRMIRSTPGANACSTCSAAWRARPRAAAPEAASSGPAPHDVRNDHAGHDLARLIEGAILEHEHAAPGLRGGPRLDHLDLHAETIARAQRLQQPDFIDRRRPQIAGGDHARFEEEFEG